MAEPLVKPEVPFVGELPFLLQPGKVIRIHGITRPNGDRFNINFATGPNSKPRDDTALHISVRLNQGYIARNSYRNGAWQDEQGSGKLPIGKAQSFKIVVLVDPFHYKIAVNGQMYCKFPHRIPYNKVTHLLVEGDIFLTSISFKNIVLSGKKSPFLGELPVALQPEKIIRVHGITHPNCDRININLATGPNSQPRDDIALHISIRLNQGCIVRNSYANNRWQDEDRSGNLPIEKGQSFKIVVLVDPLHYKIAVNGQPYCTFPHRIPYNRVTHLLVEEDSIQTSVSFDGVALPNKNVVDGQPYCEFLQRTPYTQIIHLFLTSISFKETDFLCNLPILTKIPSGLYPGKMIRFHGILYSYRFDINLTTGRNLKPQDDIALHISIRLNEGCIVMNSYRKNTWEDEERGWELPINKGQSFEVIVFMDASAYWIEINSQFHWKFLHRMPYDQVNYIMVDGNVILDSISFEEIVVLSG